MYIGMTNMEKMFRFCFEGEVIFKGIWACADVEMTEEEIRTAMQNI